MQTSTTPDSTALDPTADLALLTTKQAAKAIRIPVRTLTNYRIRGGGPRYLRVERGVYYRPADLQAWLAERESNWMADADGHAKADAGFRLNWERTEPSLRQSFGMELTISVWIIAGAGAVIAALPWLST